MEFYNDDIPSCNDNDRDDGDKPRRLEEKDETCAYLISLDAQLQKDQEECEDIDMEILVDNVLEEIKSRTASVACDRRTNLIIEKLVFASNLIQLLEIMNRFTPYIIFLARNRHSSHIMQACLSRLCYILKNQMLGDVDENLLKQRVLDFCQPMLSELHWLVKELSATHVIRSAICTLAGMPTISERKGKESKHKHSISLSQPLDTVIIPGKFYVNENICFGVPDDFHEALGTAAASFLSLPNNEIQGMIADPSSCAVFGLLLRILFNPNIIMGGPELAERIVRASLSWDDQDKGKELFYAMAGDKSGSYFLEAVIECCDVELILNIIKGTLQNSTKEYVDDNCGNFVVQTVLKRLSAELERNDSHLITEINDISDKLLEELFENDTFNEILQRRCGVVMWMLELSRWRKNNDTNNWGDKISKKLIELWTNNNSVSLISILTSKLSKKIIEPIEGAPPVSTAKRPNASRTGKKDAATLERDTSQILAAKLVGAIIRLSTTSASKSMLSAVATLPGTVLSHISSSGQLSKAILDSFFEYSVVGSSIINKLITSLLPNSIEMSNHFVGQHVIRKAFEAADEKGKEKLVTIIDENKELLNTTKEGRNSIRVVHADLFSRNVDEWKNLVHKQEKGMEMLDELFGKNTSDSSTRAAKYEQNKSNQQYDNNKSYNNNDNRNNYSNNTKDKVNDDDDDDNVNDKKKRKRKRSGKNKDNVPTKTTFNEEEEEEEEEVNIVNGNDEKEKSSEKTKKERKFY
jgi:hypothetical protein